MAEPFQRGLGWIAGKCECSDPSWSRTRPPASRAMRTPALVSPRLVANHDAGIQPTLGRPCQIDGGRPEHPYRLLGCRRAVIRLVGRCAKGCCDVGCSSKGGLLASDLRRCISVPLAGLEPAACCLGDNCPSSAQTAPVRSRQLRLGRHSVECGLVGCSRVWWNDRQNDQLSKRRRCPTARSRRARARPQGQSDLLDKQVG